MGRRQGGQGKGKPKMKDKDFGKTLIKKHAQGFDNPGGRTKQNANMMSILDNNALDDFINQAEMDGGDFEVHRVHQNHAFLVEPSRNRNIQKVTGQSFNYEHLEIPRKPAWNRNMTAEEVDMRERESFMAWRRKIATLESASNYEKKVTPFEKNLEVWRQLWRVCERSDFVIQVVDARNPLLYYTDDLRTYAAEHSPPRPMMLVINKADFLTEYQRASWVKYLEAEGIRFVFYSAVNEQNKLDKMFAALTLAERAATISSNTFGTDEDARKAQEAADALAISSKQVADAEEVSLLVQDLVDNWQEDLNDGMGEIVTVDKRRGDGPATAETSASASATKGLAVAAAGDDDTEEEEEDEDDDEIVWGAAGDGDDEDDADSSDDDDSEVEGHERQESKTKATKKAVGCAQRQGITTKKAATKKSNSMISKEDDNISGLSSETIQRRARVLNREELLLFLRMLPAKLALKMQDKNKGRFCVGMLGYPNVGKSSVINSLLGVSKAAHGVTRVAVSSTPGKTKHFQTINLSDTTMLCDCPGLVFPSFMRSTGEMICAGILPIHQMRDYIEPAAVIASRVPMHLLDASYGMHINREIDVMDNPNRPPTAHEMLCAYCAVKGYITNSTGRWDEFRACKEMLRDFADGVILYASAPPTHANNTIGLDPGNDTTIKETDETEETEEAAAYAAANAEIQRLRWLSETEIVMMRREKVAERVALKKLQQSTGHMSLGSVGSITSSNGMVLGGGAATALKQKGVVADKTALVEEEGEMVFGYVAGRQGKRSTQFVEGEEGGNAAVDAQEKQKVGPTFVDGYEVVDDSSTDEEAGGDEYDEMRSEMTGATSVTIGAGSQKPIREHKRHKHWGKKNRKLRDKNPYDEKVVGEKINFVAYTNSRQQPVNQVLHSSGPGSSAGGSVTGSVKKEKWRRQDPYANHSTPYTRTFQPTGTTAAQPVKSSGSGSGSSSANQQKMLPKAPVAAKSSADDASSNNSSSSSVAPPAAPL